MKRSVRTGALLSVAVLALLTPLASAVEDGADVWYKFTPTEDAPEGYWVALEADFAATLGIYSDAIAQPDGSWLVTEVKSPTLYSAEIASDFAAAIAEGDTYYFRVAGLVEDGTPATGGFDIGLDKNVCAIDVPEPVEILCDKDLPEGYEGDQWDYAHGLVKDAFAAVQPSSLVCALDGEIMATSITVDDDEPLDLEALKAIAADIKEFGAAEGAESVEYDGSVALTQELFHRYFMFKPGKYVVAWELGDETATMEMEIGGKCKGCLGCYSCDSCAGSRPRPEDIKRLLSEWLLIGLSFMVLMSFGTLRRK